MVEGIHLPEDLTDFNKDGLETIFGNFRRPGKVKVPKDNAERTKKEAGNPYKHKIVDQPAYVYSVKSKMRLLVATRIAKYYEAVGRTLTPENMTWKILKNFEVQYDSISERMKDDDKNEVPKLEKVQMYPSGSSPWKSTFEGVMGCGARRCCM